MSYFVLKASEDGFSVREVTKEWILTQMAEEGSGFSAADAEPTMPRETDPNYWGSKMVIIKGEIVEPIPVHVIATHDLP
jgi:hypothetical protein